MKNRAGEKQGDTIAEITGIDTIPPALIRSLNTLGLTNYEARVYATLVLFDHAEAKEIVDYLSLSKPSVYEALENLAERGLAVKQTSKPARYRAISPEMAMEMLMGEHEDSSERALSALKKLESGKVRSGSEDALWTIYGDTNIAYKIRELFSKAKKHISCVVGDRYVPFLEGITVRDLPMRLIIFSDTPGLDAKMQKKFPGRAVEIHIIPLRNVHSPPPDLAIPDFIEVWKFLKFENVLELNIDDEELLMSPAFLSGMGSVLNTRNKGAIIHMKMFSSLLWNRFIEGNEHRKPPGSVPEARTKTRVKPSNG